MSVLNCLDCIPHQKTNVVKMIIMDTAMCTLGCNSLHFRDLGKMSRDTFSHYFLTLSLGKDRLEDASYFGFWMLACLLVVFP